ncbi:MAG: hypothetical protein GY804_10160 [Alphaproteobacteria bacterium]|nr:hypothetical protein [Alphaproteobacteria bacterium]
MKSSNGNLADFLCNIRNGFASFKYLPQNITCKSYKQTIIKVCITCGLVAGASACREPMIGRLQYKPEFVGIISADEPNAALVGRQILNEGGTASDAAIATAFAMTVTMPSRVGIGGGGVCQYYNPKEKNVNTIEFVAENDETSGGKQTMPAPAFVRGMYALYAKGGGNYKWEALVVPAEKMARFGHNVSRALTTDFAGVSANKIKKLGLVNDDGALIKEGERLIQMDVANSLSKIRISAGSVYNGILAKQIIKNAHAAGFNITADQLRSFVPMVENSDKIMHGNESVYLPNISKIRKLWDYTDDDKKETAVKTASVVVADKTGGVAACSFSMGDMFGSKIKLKEIGVIAASDMSHVLLLLGSVIVVNENVNESRSGFALRDNTQALHEILEGNASDFNVGGFYCDKGIPPYPNSCISYAGNNRLGYSYVLGKE